MAEYVGLGVQPPNTMAKLSQILGMRQQRAATESAEQSQRQRANLAAFDYNQLLGEDGTFDLNKIPLIKDAAGDQYPEIATHLINAKSAQVEAKSRLLNLNTDQLNTYRSMVGGLLQDPDVVEDNPKGRQKVNDVYMHFGDMYGKDALPVLDAYAKRLQNVPQGKLADAITTYQMQANDAGKQLEAQRPNYQGFGGEAKQVNPYTPKGSAPASIPLTLSPGAQAVTRTDQLGNIYLEYRDPKGNVIGTAPIGGGEGGPARFGPGERQSLESQADQNFQNVTANRQAASMAPQQLDQINKALDLSKSVSTGAWAAKRAQIESGIGSLIPGFEGMDDASKLQELDKFSERIATDASKVLGVNAKTDAERESIHRQNANIGYTPQAIQAVLQYAKAQTMAMEAKGDAQESWLKKEGNGITKQHEFETAFRKAYDPVVFQLEAASPEERKEIVGKLTAKQAQDLKEKRKALRDLGAID